MALLSTSIDVRDMLIGDGLSASSLFIGSEPQGKKDVLTLYDTGGNSPSPKWRLDEVSFQVRSRSSKYSSCYSQLIAVRDRILGRTEITINTTRYVGFYAIGDVVHIGKNENNSTIMTCNFRAFREPEISLHRETIL